MDSKRILWIALIVSLLLHIIVLAVFPLLSTIKLDLFPSEVVAQQEEPLVFQIVETPQIPEEQQDKETDLASDKSLAAADEVESKLPEGDLPFNEGDSDVKEFQEVVEVNIPEEQQANAGKQEQRQEPQERATNSSHDPILKPKEVIPSQLQDQQNKPSYDNVISEVEKSGGISFNTYKWNFAPYMLYLKRRIQSNLHPPPGFSYLGLIHGKVLVRFEILRDGSLNDLKVLQSDAHASLVGVSTGSIEISAPFQPLPPDFPEDRLIVTSLFSYIVEKK